MKVLYEYLEEPRRFADVEGELLIELEENETLQDVIDKYIDKEVMFFETYCHSPKELEKHTHNGVEHTGRLVLLKITSPYLD